MILQKNKNIGHVLFIVEGARHEITVLKKIFINILGYKVIARTRNNPLYYQSKINNHNVIAIVNTQTSNINSIQDENGFLDTIFEELIQNYDFNLSNAAIYYLFDRDVLSNTDSNLIRNLLTILKNSRENGNDMQGGLLLLNYPSIESFDISNFCDDTCKLEYTLGSELKQFINENATSISLNKLSENTLVKATDEMMKYYLNDGLDLDLDDMSKNNLHIYDKQETKFKDSGTYHLLSLLSIAFLDLGIISE